MQVAVSVFLLAVGALILFTKHDPITKNAAAGWIGAVIGYWLH